MSIRNVVKNAVKQEAAKAYLARISNIESLEFEPGAEHCDDSWMEYINEDCMTVASNSSYSTPSLSYENESQYSKISVSCDIDCLETDVVKEARNIFW